MLGCSDMWFKKSSKQKRIYSRFLNTTANETSLLPREVQGVMFVLQKTEIKSTKPSKTADNNVVGNKTCEKVATKPCNAYLDYKSSDEIPILNDSDDTSNIDSEEEENEMSDSYSTDSSPAPTVKHTLVTETASLNSILSRTSANCITSSNLENEDAISSPKRKSSFSSLYEDVVTVVEKTTDIPLDSYVTATIDFGIETDQVETESTLSEPMDFCFSSDEIVILPLTNKTDYSIVSPMDQNGVDAESFKNSDFWAHINVNTPEKLESLTKNVITRDVDDMGKNKKTDPFNIHKNNVLFPGSNKPVKVLQLDNPETRWTFFEGLLDRNAIDKDNLITDYKPNKINFNLPKVEESIIEVEETTLTYETSEEYTQTKQTGDSKKDDKIVKRRDLTKSTDTQPTSKSIKSYDDANNRAEQKSNDIFKKTVPVYRASKETNPRSNIRENDYLIRTDAYVQYTSSSRYEDCMDLIENRSELSRRDLSDMREDLIPREVLKIVKKIESDDEVIDNNTIVIIKPNGIRKIILLPSSMERKDIVEKKSNFESNLFVYNASLSHNNNLSSNKHSEKQKLENDSSNSNSQQSDSKPESNQNSMSLKFTGDVYEILPKSKTKKAEGCNKLNLDKKTKAAFNSTSVDTKDLKIEKQDMFTATVLKNKKHNLINQEKKTKSDSETVNVPNTDNTNNNIVDEISKSDPNSVDESNTDQSENNIQSETSGSDTQTVSKSDTEKYENTNSNENYTLHNRSVLTVDIESLQRVEDLENCVFIDSSTANPSQVTIKPCTNKQSKSKTENNVYIVERSEGNPTLTKGTDKKIYSCTVNSINDRTTVESTDEKTHDAMTPNYLQSEEFREDLKNNLLTLLTPEISELLVKILTQNMTSQKLQEGTHDQKQISSLNFDQTIILKDDKKNDNSNTDIKMHEISIFEDMEVVKNSKSKQNAELFVYNVSIDDSHNTREIKRYEDQVNNSSFKKTKDQGTSAFETQNYLDEEVQVQKSEINLVDKSTSGTETINIKGMKNTKIQTESTNTLTETNSLSEDYVTDNSIQSEESVEVKQDEDDEEISSSFEKNKNLILLNDLLVTVLRSEIQENEWSFFRSFDGNENNVPPVTNIDQNSMSEQISESKDSIEPRKVTDSEPSTSYRTPEVIVCAASSGVCCTHSCKECKDPCSGNCQTNKCKSKCNKEKKEKKEKEKKPKKKKGEKCPLTANVNHFETFLTPERREFFVTLLAFLKKVSDDKDCTEKSFYKLMGKEKTAGCYQMHKSKTQVYACDKTCKCPCEKSIGNAQKQKFDSKCTKKSLQKKEKERKKKEKEFKKCLKKAQRSNKNYFCKGCCRPGKECNICKESRCDEEQIRACCSEINKTCSETKQKPQVCETPSNESCNSSSSKTKPPSKKPSKSSSKPCCKPPDIPECALTDDECSSSCIGQCRDGAQKDPCDACTCKAKKKGKKKKEKKVDERKECIKACKEAAKCHKNKDLKNECIKECKYDEKKECLKACKEAAKCHKDKDLKNECIKECKYDETKECIKACKEAAKCHKNKDLKNECIKACKEAAKCKKKKPDIKECKEKESIRPCNIDTCVEKKGKEKQKKSSSKADCCQPMPKPCKPPPKPSTSAKTNMEYLFTFLNKPKPCVGLTKDQQLCIGKLPGGPVCKHICGNLAHFKSCLTCQKPKIKKMSIQDSEPEVPACKPPPEPEPAQPCYAYNVSEAVSEILGSQHLGDLSAFGCDSKNPLLYEVAEHEHNSAFTRINVKKNKEKEIQTEENDAADLKNTGIVTSRCYLPERELCSNENSCCKFIYTEPRCLVHNECEKVVFNYCPSCTTSRKSVISNRSNKSNKSNKDAKATKKRGKLSLRKFKRSPGKVSGGWHKKQAVPVNYAEVPAKRSREEVENIMHYHQLPENESRLDENTRKHKFYYKYEYEYVPVPDGYPVKKEVPRRPIHPRRPDDVVVETVPEDEPTPGTSLSSKKKSTLTTLKAYYTFESKPKLTSREKVKIDFPTPEPPHKLSPLPKKKCSYEDSTLIKHFDYEAPPPSPRSVKRGRNENTYYAMDTNLPDFLTEPRRERDVMMRQYDRPRRHVEPDNNIAGYMFDTSVRQPTHRNIARAYERPVPDIRNNVTQQRPQRLPPHYDDGPTSRATGTACTMKPSARQEFACQTTRKNQSTAPDSHSILCPTLSLTNICKDRDKQNLKSVYYLLTAIDGRVRRMKKSIPESSFRFR